MDSMDPIHISLNIIQKEIDQYSHAINKIENRMDDLNSRIEKELEDIRESIIGLSKANDKIMNSLEDTLELQKSSEPIMETIENITRGGMIIKWVIMAIIGALGAMAAATSTWEFIQRWRGRE